MSSSSVTQLFNYNNFVHAVAGGCGSAVAMTACYPLDTVRTRLQLEDSLRSSRNILIVLGDIYKQEGIIGLYRGLMPVIESLYCSNFVYFYAFHSLKRAGNPDKSALKDLAFAMLAGSINVMVTNPLWVVNTRIKMQGAKMPNSRQPTQDYNYRGMLDGLIKLYRSEGITGMWSGALSSLILVVNPAIQFMTYEAVKRRLLEQQGGKGELNSLVVFSVGAFAKAVATVITYPIQLVQAKQRHGLTHPQLPDKPGLITLLLFIIRHHGFKGLFKGMEAKILQTVLTAALMFVCYEKIAAVVFAVMLRNRNGGLK